MAPVSKTKKTPKPLRPTKQAPKKRYLSLTETLNLRFVPARKVSWKESILFRASYYTETLCQEGRKRAYAIAAYHNGPFRLFDLPDELQLHIFRFVVVRPNTHVWPDMKTGREQHDLTMVDKKTRMKVLPLFYGENIFAFDASPRGFGHRFRTWTEKIGQQNFRHIRQFAIWDRFGQANGDGCQDDLISELVRGD
ncbi:hypothetical protein M8818_005479 [Zalaria obscura]|uniref:Uncharacterized protein n=1 Tax=Zalaria obscura TaxID=2024903 RepID=A0ACC3S836_9PEZI